MCKGALCSLVQATPEIHFMRGGHTVVVCVHRWAPALHPVTRTVLGVGTRRVVEVARKEVGGAGTTGAAEDLDGFVNRRQRGVLATRAELVVVPISHLLLCTAAQQLSSVWTFIHIGHA